MNAGLKAAIDGVQNVHDLDVELETYAQGALAGLAEHIGSKEDLARIRDVIEAWGLKGTPEEFALAVRAIDVVIAMRAEL